MDSFCVTLLVIRKITFFIFLGLYKYLIESKFELLEKNRKICIFIYLFIYLFYFSRVALSEMLLLY